MLAGLKNIFSSRGSSRLSTGRSSRDSIPDRIVVDDLMSRERGEPSPTVPSGSLVEFDLRYLVSELPDQLRSQVERDVAAGNKVRLPAALLSRKVAKNDLTISFGTLKKMSPRDIFKDDTTYDHKRVALNVEETKRQLQGRAPTNFKVDDLNIPSEPEEITSQEEGIKLSSPVEEIHPGSLEDPTPQAVKFSEPADSGPMVLHLSKIEVHLPDACKQEIKQLPAGFRTPLHIPAKVAHAFFETADATASWADFWSWFVPEPPVTGFNHSDPIKIPMEIFIPEYLAWKNAPVSNVDRSAEINVVESLDLAGLEIEDSDILGGVEFQESTQAESADRDEVLSPDRVGTLDDATSTQKEKAQELASDLFEESGSANDFLPHSMGGSSNSGLLGGSDNEPVIGKSPCIESASQEQQQLPDETQEIVIPVQDKESEQLEVPTSDFASDVKSSESTEPQISNSDQFVSGNESEENQSLDEFPASSEDFQSQEPVESEQNEEMLSSEALEIVSDESPGEIVGVEIGSLPESITNEPEESSLGALPSHVEDHGIAPEIEDEANAAFEELETSSEPEPLESSTPQESDAEAQAQIEIENDEPVDELPSFAGIGTDEEPVADFETGYEETPEPSPFPVSDSELESDKAFSDEISIEENQDAEVSLPDSEPESEEEVNEAAHEGAEDEEVSSAPGALHHEVPTVQMRQSRKAHDPEFLRTLVGKINFSQEASNHIDEQTDKLARMFFQPEKKLWTTDEIIAKTSLLEGVDGIVVSLEDGMIAGSSVHSDIDPSEIGKDIPALFNQSASLCKKPDSQGPECLSIDFDGQSVHVFKSGQLYLMAFTDRETSVPQKQLKFVTSYLSRKLG